MQKLTSQQILAFLAGRPTETPIRLSDQVLDRILADAEAFELVSNPYQLDEVTEDGTCVEGTHKSTK